MKKFACPLILILVLAALPLRAEQGPYWVPGFDGKGTTYAPRATDKIPNNNQPSMLVQVWADGATTSACQIENSLDGVKWYAVGPAISNVGTAGKLYLGPAAPWTRLNVQSLTQPRVIFANFAPSATAAPNGWKDIATYTATTAGINSLTFVTPTDVFTNDSPITTDGTVTLAKVAQAKNKFYAGPATGADAAPTFRVFNDADFANTLNLSIGTLTAATTGKFGPASVQIGDFDTLEADLAPQLRSMKVFTFGSAFGTGASIYAQATLADGSAASGDVTAVYGVAGSGSHTATLASPFFEAARFYARSWSPNITNATLNGAWLGAMQFDGTTIDMAGGIGAPVVYGGTADTLKGLSSQVAVYKMGTPAATATTGFNFFGQAPLIGGGGTLTNGVGIAQDEMAGATNNTNLLLGTLTNPAGDWNIYSASTNKSHFVGGLEILKGSAKSLYFIDPTAQTARLLAVNSVAPGADYQINTGVIGESLMETNTRTSPSAYGGLFMAGFASGATSTSGNPTGVRAISRQDVAGTTTGFLVGADASASVSAGTAGQLRGVYATAVAGTSPSTRMAAGWFGSSAVGGTVVVPLMEGVHIENSAVLSGAAATNSRGICIEGPGPGTNKATALFGTDTQPSGSWGVYSTSAYASYFGVTADVVPFTLNGVAGQTANLQDWTVNGVIKATIRNDGSFITPKLLVSGSGPAAVAGTATVDGVTGVTISTTAVSASSVIIVSYNTPKVGVTGIISAPVADIVVGTSFKIYSTDAADTTSTVNWILVN